ncbi:hypothetical protein HJ107_20765 [Vibrio parahaemolyticus]|nr:hypothetical protein [Vibrio parahaemolyticus]
MTLGRPKRQSESLKELQLLLNVLLVNALSGELDIVYSMSLMQIGSHLPLDKTIFVSFGCTLRRRTKLDSVPLSRTDDLTS